METTIIHEIVFSRAIGQIISHDVPLLFKKNYILNVGNSFAKLEREENKKSKIGFLNPELNDFVILQNIKTSQY